MSIILESEPTIREKIFRTSVELFIQFGYEKVSLRQIAREVGIAHNTILHYFGSKEGLASEVNHRSRKLLFEKAFNFYQTVPEDQRVPEMGLLAYHILLYKLAEGDPVFGQTYYDLRRDSSYLMIEGHDDSFFTNNMTKLFPGFHYRQMSTPDFKMGMSIVNNCTLAFLYFLLHNETTIRKIIKDYFRVYSYFLLDVSYADTFATDFYDTYNDALVMNHEEFLQELLSYKSYY